jgi:hypothetical protein
MSAPLTSDLFGTLTWMPEDEIYQAVYESEEQALTIFLAAGIEQNVDFAELLARAERELPLLLNKEPELKKRLFPQFLEEYATLNASGVSAPTERNYLKDVALTDVWFFYDLDTDLAYTSHWFDEFEFVISVDEEFHPTEVRFDERQ